MKTIKSLSSVFLAILICVLTFPSAMASNIPANLSDEEILALILTGEGYYLGNGVPINEFENSGTGPRWASGTDGTHQYITSYGLSILNNDKLSVYNWYTSHGNNILSTIIVNSDWPDDNETDQRRFTGHFYYADAYNDNHTALTRFTQHYNAAVSYYEDGSYTNAFAELGRAIHYLEDASTPVHASLDYYGLYAPIKHPQYENYVNDHLSSYQATTSSQYTLMNTSFTNIFDTIALYAYNRIPTDWSDSGIHASASLAVPRAMGNVAGILNRFYNDVT